MIEHPQSTIYKNILESNAVLKAIITSMKAIEGRDLTKNDLDEAVVSHSQIVYDSALGK